ncbi:MAG TPA: hypothetical protein PKM12_07555, partial [Marmoricola sp.]|nr:hypothetical protein [Marmoricola sp.]
MPKRVVHLADPDISIDGRTLRDRVLGIQQELRVSAEFPPGVEACARDAVALPRLPTLTGLPDLPALPGLTTLAARAGLTTLAARA